MPDDPLEQLKHVRGLLGGKYGQDENYGLMVQAAIAAWEKERAQLRDTIQRLNRRCQLADSALAENAGGGPSFGRALANYAADKAIRDLERERAVFNKDQETTLRNAASLRAVVLQVAEEMDGLPKAVEYVRSMGTAVVTGPYAEWAARLRKACE